MTAELLATQRLLECSRTHLEMFDYERGLDLEKVASVTKETGYVLFSQVLSEISKYLPDLDYRVLNYHLDNFEVDFTYLKWEAVKQRIKNHFLMVAGREEEAMPIAEYRLNINPNERLVVLSLLRGSDRISLLRQMIMASKSRVVVKDDAHTLYVSGLAVTCEDLDGDLTDNPGHEISYGHVISEAYVDFLLYRNLGYDDLQIPILNLLIQRLDCLMDEKLYYMFCHDPLAFYQQLELLMPKHDRYNLEEAIRFIRNYNKILQDTVMHYTDDRDRVIQMVNENAKEAIDEVNGILDRAFIKKESLACTRKRIDN